MSDAKLFNHSLLLIVLEKLDTNKKYYNLNVYFDYSIKPKTSKVLNQIAIPNKRITGLQKEKIDGMIEENKKAHFSWALVLVIAKYSITSSTTFSLFL